MLVNEIHSVCPVSLLTRSQLFRLHHRHWILAIWAGNWHFTSADTEFSIFVVYFEVFQISFQFSSIWNNKSNKDGYISSYFVNLLRSKIFRIDITNAKQTNKITMNILYGCKIEFFMLWFNITHTVSNVTCKLYS